MSDFESDVENVSDDEFDENSDDYNESDGDSDDISTIIKEITTQNTANEPILTPNIITKYEYTKLIGVRSQMISMGALPQINQEYIGNKTPTEIAIIELDTNVIPLIIKRVVNKHITEFCDPNKMELI